MMATSKSLAYSAVLVAALSLASCSEGSRDPQSTSAAQPAAAIAQRQFNVYFDVDKSGLTPEARQLIAQVVAQANRDASVNLVVLVGKTDIAGVDRNDIGPAQRRADTVHAALIAGGIAPERISERSVGHHEPSIPTPSGVREPRNRVVEVAFQ
jgi:OmpA-OmpF porin, OOP family